MLLSQRVYTSYVAEGKKIFSLYKIPCYEHVLNSIRGRFIMNYEPFIDTYGIRCMAI